MCLLVGSSNFLLIKYVNLSMLIKLVIVEIKIVFYYYLDVFLLIIIWDQDNEWSVKDF